jgi:hypothetical protein
MVWALLAMRWPEMSCPLAGCTDHGLGCAGQGLTWAGHGLCWASTVLGIRWVAWGAHGPG